jgi:hypothetical protein
MINHTDTIVIRPAGPGDGPTVQRLAALDSAHMPAAPILLVERDGDAVAAVSLTDGAIVADPFTPTSDLVELLRIHAETHGTTRPSRLGRRSTHRRTAVHALAA